MLIPKQFIFLIFDPVFSLSEMFTPPPPKSEVSLLIVKILKICPKAVFDNSKEASESTDSEKNRNNLQKYPILTKNTKNYNLLRFFLIFSENVIFKELWSFVLRSWHQNASFELSRIVFVQFFKIFTIKGDPSDLEGSKFQARRRRFQKLKLKTLSQSA